MGKIQQNTVKEEAAAMTQASFQPQGYLRFDLSQGQVSTPDKRRHLVVPAEILRAAGQPEELAKAARQWGEEQGTHLVSLIGGDLLSESPERFVGELAHLMATLGWGWCELQSWGGVLFVVVQQAPRGASTDILANFLAGAFSSASGQRFDCVHVPEDGASRFLLTGPESVGTVKAWVEAGQDAGQIVSRMHAGEHLAGPNSK